MKKLLLASTSPYRKALLLRLGIEFEAQKPLFDEEAYVTNTRPPSDPVAWAQSLAFLKAQSLSTPEATVIGGDQLISFQGEILGKPKTKQKAILQLQKMQGATHELVTAVCVLSGGLRREFVNVTKIALRSLTLRQIEKYVALDLPLDCAGSYKIELHGIALIQSIETQDPTAIEGLPLIQLTQTLLELGYENFSAST